jgi:hypothetical protein
MVTEDFAKWASGFSGCDGGNPRGGIWLCGIEYGGGGDSEGDLNFSEDVSKPRSEARAVGDFCRFQYNSKALKLLCALSGRDVRAYRSFYEDRRCFSSESDYFKLNLYPIGFRDTSARWEDWLARKTGILTKAEYTQWCETQRFPQLRKWSQQYRPRLIICTGKSHRSAFFRAFCGFSEPHKLEDQGEKPFWYIQTNSGHTLVAVVYFLGGRHGLNSDPKLADTGQRLRELMNRMDTE